MSRGFIIAIISLIVIGVLAFSAMSGLESGSNPTEAGIAILFIIALVLVMVVLGRLLGTEGLLRQNLRVFPSEREWIAEMYSYLARALAAGKTPSEGLAQYSGDAGPGWIRRRLKQMVFSMQSGQSLSSAAARFPAVFPPQDRMILEVGERGENLADACEYLASLTRSRQFKNFPAFLLALELVYAPLVIGFIMVFIIPKYKDIFDQLGGVLPTPTIWLINISYYVLNWFGYAVLILILVVIVIRMLGLWRHMIGVVPLFRRLYWSLVYSRFAFAMGSLLQAGLAPLAAVSYAVQASGNKVFRAREKQMLEALEQGKPLHEAFAAVPELSQKFVWLVSRGESREAPDETLLMLSEQYREEHEIALFRLGAIMLPIAILLIGVAIGFCVIALYLPLFDIPAWVGRQG